MELSAHGSASTSLLISSPSASSKSSLSSASRAPSAAFGSGGDTGSAGPAQARWEDVNEARQRAKALKEILGPIRSLEALQESERPSKALLEDGSVAQAILAHLCNPSCGHREDALCQWLYDTFQTGKTDLQAIVLRFIPAICGLYLSRVMNHDDESLAGFEAVLLALYTAETKARNGHPLVVHVPDLSHQSLYHTPRLPPSSLSEPRIGCISAALEPQDAVRATKRECIVSVALDCFGHKIAYMPTEAKIEACQCALRWAILSCAKDQETFNAIQSVKASVICSKGQRDLDSDYHFRSSSSTQQVPPIEIVGPGELFLGNRAATFWGSQSSALKHSSRAPYGTDYSKVNFLSSLMQAGNGARIRVSWELVRPLLKILGHCLLAPSNPESVKEAALAAINALHQRAFHDLSPEAMLGTRSLMRLHVASKIMATPTPSLNSVSGSSKLLKDEMHDILLGSN